MERSNQIGQLGAAARDMELAATLEDERRLALERHAVERFWKACGIDTPMRGASVPLRSVGEEG
jgi:hypothetical protein